MSQYEIPENSKYEFVEFKYFLEDKVGAFEWNKDVSLEDRVMIITMGCLGLAWKVYNVSHASDRTFPEFLKYMSDMSEINE